MKLKYYLIASENNDYRPWVLSTQAIVVFCLIIWGIRIFTPVGITLAESIIDTQDLMNKVNSERTQRFIPALITNSKLTTAAFGKGNDMIARSYFAHIDPDGNYVWPRIEATGYKPYVTLGENLAMDFTSAQSVIDAWMNSPTHRANIVNDKFEDQGMASVAGTYEPNHSTIMVVNLFGTLYKTSKPSPAPSPAPVASTTKKPRTPSPVPATPAAVAAKPAPAPLEISKDIKISSTRVSGHTIISLDTVINGSPTLVTAKLKTQSITLLPGKVQGQFVGSFTFDSTENLSEQAVTVEARNQAGAKTSLDFGINFASSEGVADGNQTTINAQIPVSNEARIINILRIIFGLFAVVYMAFLAIDAIVIHRAKISRPGIHTNTHALVFLLIAAVSIFANWF
jgi:hypothetical protein